MVRRLCMCCSNLCFLVLVLVATPVFPFQIFKFGIPSITRLHNWHENSACFQTIAGLFQKCSTIAEFRTAVLPILMQNASVLTRGRDYECFLEHHLKENSSYGLNDTYRINEFNALVRSFLDSERKAQAQLKLHYILAGAAARQLDTAIQRLHMRCVYNSTDIYSSLCCTLLFHSHYNNQ